MRTSWKRTTGLVTTVLGVASLGVSLLGSPASAALDTNPRTRELKEAQRYATVGDVDDGDCGTQFDVDEGIIWHFIADNMVVGSVVVSWSATFAATDGGPVVETVTATPEIKIVGNGKTYHFYTQSQNLFVANAVVTLDRDQTELDMQLSHICGASVPTGESTTTTTSTTTTEQSTTTTAPEGSTTTTEATVLGTTLVREPTTTTIGDPSTPSTLRTEVLGVTQTRELPRTGEQPRRWAYSGLGVFLVGLGLVLLAEDRKLGRA